ncbi:MAG: hypothetical protein ACKOAD_01895 [Gammaproteobacteria bacterium]
MLEIYSCSGGYRAASVMQIQYLNEHLLLQKIDEEAPFAEIKDLLNQDKNLVNKLFNYGDGHISALAWSCIRGNILVIEYLLELGARGNQPLRISFTGKIYPCSHIFEVVILLQNDMIFNLLSKHGAQLLGYDYCNKMIPGFKIELQPVSKQYASYYSFGPIVIPISKNMIYSHLYAVNFEKSLSNLKSISLEAFEEILDHLPDGHEEFVIMALLHAIVFLKLSQSVIKKIEEKIKTVCDPYALVLWSCLKSEKSPLIQSFSATCMDFSILNWLRHNSYFHIDFQFKVIDFIQKNSEYLSYVSKLFFLNTEVEKQFPRGTNETHALPSGEQTSLIHDLIAGFYMKNTEAMSILNDLLKNETINLNVQDFNGRTPIFVAIQFNNEQAIDLLMSRRDVATSLLIIKDKQGYTAREYGEKKGILLYRYTKSEILKNLLNKQSIHDFDAHTVEVMNDLVKIYSNIDEIQVCKNNIAEAWLVLESLKKEIFEFTIQSKNFDSDVVSRVFLKLKDYREEGMDLWSGVHYDISIAVSCLWKACCDFESNLCKDSFLNGIQQAATAYSVQDSGSPVSCIQGIIGFIITELSGLHPKIPEMSVLALLSKNTSEKVNEIFYLELIMELYKTPVFLKEVQFFLKQEAEEGRHLKNIQEFSQRLKNKFLHKINFLFEVEYFSASEFLKIKTIAEDLSNNIEYLLLGAEKVSSASLNLGKDPLKNISIQKNKKTKTAFLEKTKEALKYLLTTYGSLPRSFLKFQPEITEELNLFDYQNLKWISESVFYDLNPFHENSRTNFLLRAINEKNIGSMRAKSVALALIVANKNNQISHEVIRFIINQINPLQLIDLCVVLRNQVNSIKKTDPFFECFDSEPFRFLNFYRNKNIVTYKTWVNHLFVYNPFNSDFYEQNFKTIICAITDGLKFEFLIQKFQFEVLGAGYYNLLDVLCLNSPLNYVLKLYELLPEHLFEQLVTQSGLDNPYAFLSGKYRNCNKSIVFALKMQKSCFSRQRKFTLINRLIENSTIELSSKFVYERLILKDVIFDDSAEEGLGFVKNIINLIPAEFPEVKRTTNIFSEIILCILVGAEKRFVNLVSKQKPDLLLLATSFHLRKEGQDFYRTKVLWYPLLLSFLLPNEKIRNSILGHLDYVFREKDSGDASKFFLDILFSNFENRGTTIEGSINNINIELEAFSKDYVEKILQIVVQKRMGVRDFDDFFINARTCQGLKVNLLQSLFNVKNYHLTNWLINFISTRINYFDICKKINLQTYNSPLLAILKKNDLRKYFDRKSCWSMNFNFQNENKILKFMQYSTRQRILSLMPYWDENAPESIQFHYKAFILKVLDRFNSSELHIKHDAFFLDMYLPLGLAWSRNHRAIKTIRVTIENNTDLYPLMHLLKYAETIFFKFLGLPVPLDFQNFLFQLRFLNPRAVLAILRDKIGENNLILNNGLVNLIGFSRHNQMAHQDKEEKTEREEKKIDLGI